jgi:hypothetical protein
VCGVRAEAPDGTATASITYLAGPRGGDEDRAGDADRLAEALGSPPVGEEALATLPRRRREEPHPLWPWALAIALALVPLDVALHRRAAA